ncbi:DUF3413 domain-containing protein [Spectribacter hydrogenooxidans]|uniref:DUF3413 domain-containing protein n=1 Tax=Spectribacter hydrogenoxidans TaxID=3075608 RepID=A0ABU3C0X3_9GAMM|nr:DUF3413 domain-containing protein [Salinisphaera sp. W335]MDT0635031.1 DUF3413 domain-containing protein [Salinisphaera sp. W335]
MTARPFSPDHRPRPALLRWTGWLFAANTLLMLLLGLRYLFYAPWPTDVITAVYMVCAVVGHFALLGMLPWLLIVVPLVLLWPRPAIIRPLATVMVALMLAVLLLDTLVFAENRFHFNALTVAILGWKTWGFGAFYALIFLLLFFLLGRMLWAALARGRPRGGGLLAAGLFGCLLAAHVIHIWGDARYFVPVTSFSPYLPLYEPVTAKSFLERHDLMHVAPRQNDGALAAAVSRHSQRLDYPEKVLVCNRDDPPLNVLLVVVDALRGDSLNRRLMPRLSAFARDRALRFDHHFSGGNSSRMGLFSLFYGLPSTYWEDFYNLNRGPVLFDRMQVAGYDFGLFSSKPLVHPTGLDRTAFADLTIQPHPAQAPDYEQDRRLNQLWFNWLDARHSERPFFGFLFYDSLNGREFPPDYPHIAEADGDSALARKRGDYRTSVHFLDSLVGEVLDDLEQRGRLRDTVVMMTADHGQSFDDYGLGYVGYGSNFSDAQLHVPLVVHWPGREPARIERRTAHVDVPPTLLTGVLGCSNAPSDYSVGSDLFAGQPWDWLVAGSYSEYAVVQPDRVTVVKPGGYVEVRGDDYRVLEDVRVDRARIEQALQAMGRFYR